MPWLTPCVSCGGGGGTAELPTLVFDVCAGWNGTGSPSTSPIRVIVPVNVDGSARAPIEYHDVGNDNMLLSAPDAVTSCCCPIDMGGT